MSSIRFGLQACLSRKLANANHTWNTIRPLVTTTARINIKTFYLGSLTHAHCFKASYINFKVLNNDILQGVHTANFCSHGHVEDLGSRIRQNYHKECEEAVNKQINLELQASHTYLSMAYYFDRDDVALKGFYNYFKKLSSEERNHAESLMKYQNKRGGQIILKDIKGPVKNNWLGGLEAMEAALEMEKSVNQSLLELHTLANSHGDVQLCDYLGSYLHEQVDSIMEISKHITNLKRVGIGLGKYLHDKHGLHSSSSNEKDCSSKF